MSVVEKVSPCLIAFLIFYKVLNVIYYLAWMFSFLGKTFIFIYCIVIFSLTFIFVSFFLQKKKTFRSSVLVSKSLKPPNMSGMLCSAFNCMIND